MKTAKKVVFNTVVLYAKVLISLAISLITIPMVLHALGQSDYGLYNLVGGIVAMLAFLNTSMSVSTQRFMSVAMGEGNIEKIKRVFNVNIRLHLLLGIVIVIGLELIGLFAFDRLNIEPDSVYRAKIIFQFLIVSFFTNIVCVPFNGVINAREDMLVFSIIGLIQSLLNLGVAALLSRVSVDKLLVYGLGMMSVHIIIFLLTFFFVRKAYPEYKINLREYKDKNLFKETFGFVGWNLFGAVALMTRNQGTAVVVNLFFGTVVNASYGVAHHINSAMSHFSSTFQKAINPQLMKSEGMNNRNRLHSISFISSKFGVLALCIFAIPIILEMPTILDLWLKKDIPPYTIQLSRLVLLLSIVTQYSSGLMSSIQAVGKIRRYQIVMGIVLLLNLPIAYLLLKKGYPVYYTTVAFVLMEMCSFVIRLFMARHLTGTKIASFLKEVVCPTMIIVSVSTGVALVPHYLMGSGILRAIITLGAYEVVFLPLVWYIAVDKSFRESILSQVHERLHRTKR